MNGASVTPTPDEAGSHGISSNEIDLPVVLQEHEETRPAKNSQQQIPPSDRAGLWLIKVSQACPTG